MVFKWTYLEFLAKFKDFVTICFLLMEYFLILIIFMNIKFWYKYINYC